MSIITVTCYNCGAIKEVDDIKTSYVCPMCMKRNQIEVHDEITYIDVSLILTDLMEDLVKEENISYIKKDSTILPYEEDE